MILKFKAFIYRFFAIFGLRVFLAQKEQDSFIEGLPTSKLDRSIAIGLWQARCGFTTVYTRKMPFVKAMLTKIKHAFSFWRFG
jgi:hypothetical protein